MHQFLVCDKNVPKSTSVVRTYLVSSTSPISRTKHADSKRTETET
jgi:hypothetical protein